MIVVIQNININIFWMYGELRNEVISAKETEQFGGKW